MNECELYASKECTIEREWGLCGKVIDRASKIVIVIKGLKEW
jgi:hypothetical protein